ncbi:MAG: hypothetical protein AB8B97_26685 [Granulosicoccus sp.]
MYSSRQSKASLFTCLIASLVLLSACSSSDDPEPQRVNLDISSVSNLTDLEISYPFDMTLGVTSTRPIDAEFSLFLIEKTAVEGRDAVQIPVGSGVIPAADFQSSSGSSASAAYSFEMSVPASVGPPGEYYLQIIVDPTDEVVETDETDNVFVLEVDVAPPIIPNAYITELALDRAALEINTGDYNDLVNLVEDNVYNADAAATITMGADGLRDNEPLDIEAFANLRMARSDTGTTHDVPLYLWNTEAGRYINAYGVDPTGTALGGTAEWLPIGNLDPQSITGNSERVEVDDKTLNSEYINFYFPGRLGSELASKLRFPPITGGFTTNSSNPTLPPPDLNAQAISELGSFLSGLPITTPGDETSAMAVMDFSICVQIRPVNQSVSEVDTADNESCQALMITLPPTEDTILPPVSIDGYTPLFNRPSQPLSTGTSYKTKGGGSAFGFGMELGSFASADERGYREGIYGDLPVTIFGQSFSFMKASVDAQLVPDYPGKPASEESKFDLEIIHAGLLLTRIIEVPTNVEITLELDKLSISKELPDPEKNGIAESTIFVGPIPLSAGAYVTGNFGLSFTPFIFTNEAPDNYRLGVQGGPFANIEGTMYAALGSRRLPITAGVEGVLRLLDGRFTLFNGVDIAVRDKPVATDPVEFVITQGPKGTLSFTGPQGKINLFVRYVVPSIESCDLGIIKVPCPGLASVKATKNIYSSPALFRFSDVLFEDPGLQLSVVLRDNEDPLFFQP